MFFAWLQCRRKRQLMIDELRAARERQISFFDACQEDILLEGPIELLQKLADHEQRENRLRNHHNASLHSQLAARGYSGKQMSKLDLTIPMEHRFAQLYRVRIRRDRDTQMSATPPPPPPPVGGQELVLPPAPLPVDDLPPLFQPGQLVVCEDWPGILGRVLNVDYSSRLAAVHLLNGTTTVVALNRMEHSALEQA